MNMFQARSVRCAFLGYSCKRKGYKLLYLSSLKFLISKDVIFIETIFPFKDEKIDNQHTYNQYVYSDDEKEESHTQAV